MKRLDQFDYESMSIKDNWRVRETVEMLVCVKMEANEYFSRSDSAEIYKKLFDMYEDYLTKIMFAKELTFTTPYEEKEYCQDLNNGIDTSLTINTMYTYFSKGNLLQILQNNNKAKIDISALMNYLEGKELPRTTSYNVKIGNDNITSDTKQQLTVSFEDSSDEGIPQEVKDMNLPTLRKKVKELTAEKDKWDKSIEAAVNLGLLFYENGLEKPAKKEVFIKEFSAQLGKELPDSTIDLIYATLPSRYKLSGGRPKKDDATANIENIIRAAAFAGTLYEAPERLKLSNLKDELKDLEINPPDDVTLKKIIDAVKDLDI